MPTTSVRTFTSASLLFAIAALLLPTTGWTSGNEDPNQLLWDDEIHQCGDTKCDTQVCMDEHTTQCWAHLNATGCQWQGTENPTREISEVEGPWWDEQFGRYRYEQHLVCIADGTWDRTLKWDRPRCWDSDELGENANGDPGICVDRSEAERREDVTNVAGPCVGNPCNPATGDKIIRETDFEGVGIHFYRTWHSKGAIRSATMWSRWTHSYADFLDFDEQGALLAVVTPDGYYMTLSATTGGVWIAPVRTGLRVVQSGSEYVVEYPNGETRFYDATGRLDRVEASPGQLTTLTYNTSDQLTEIIGPFGHKVRLVYNGNTGMLVYLYQPDNKRYRYTSSYAHNRYNLTRIQKPSRGYVYYEYNDPNWPEFITDIKDELGIIYASYTYDASTGNALSSERAGGAGRVDLSYTADSTAVTDGDGRITTYNFQNIPFGGRRLVSSVRDGTTESRAFLDGQTDALQRLGSRTSASGQTTNFGYDDHHRTSVTEAVGTPLARTTTYEYLRPDSNAVTRIIRPSAHGTLNAETTITYNALDLPLTITQSGYDSAEQLVSRTTTLTYNADGQVLTIDGPRTDVSDVTTIAYYNCTTGGNCGQIHTITNALGHTTTFNSYNANGQLTKETGPNGYVREYIYNWRGFLTSIKIKSPTGYSRTYNYTYNTAGIVTAAPAGPYMTTLNFTYDGARRLVEVRDAANNRVKYVYDSAGNVIEERTEDSSGNVSRLMQATFDTLSRLDTISNGGAVTDVLYDSVGKLSESEDPNQNLTQYLYDELDRLTTVVDPATGSATTAYDVNDRPTLVTATNGAATSFVYDDLGNLEREISPDRGTISYTHDAAGNVLTRTDARGITVTYTYDALNRLVSETHPDSSKDVAFGYDASIYNLGYLTSMTDESGSTTWNHYAPGPSSHQRTIEKTQVTNGQTLVTSYVVHSLTGLPYSMTYPSGTTLTYTLSGSTGLVTAMNFGGTSVLSNATYDPFGPVNGWTWGNGASYSISYNQRGEVVSYNLGADTRTLTYDLGSRLLTQSDTEYQLGYGYDSLDRVTSFTAAPQAGGTLVPPAQSFTYDENSNRLSFTENSQNTDYSVAANSNRMQSSTGAIARTYTYDAAGNTLSDGIHTYVYDDRGRMESVNGGATSYRYTGAGERVQKTTGSQTTIFVYGPKGELLGEYDGFGNAIQETVWYEGRPVATRQGSIVYFVHADHLGTPRAVSEGNAVVWRWDSDPFGYASPDTDPDADQVQFTYNLRFPGQYWDIETGLHYNYFRTYDPSTGRYLESDPIGLEGGPNSYTYAIGNPVMYFDPLGLEIVGEWVTRPWAFVSDAEVEFGRGNARRPDDWWMIWRHLGTYRSMEHRVSVQAGFLWRVRCTDDEACSGEGDTWHLFGGYVDWHDVWIPINTPAVPHPYGYYVALSKITYNMLVRPATSRVMETMTVTADAFGKIFTPTLICKIWPRQRD